MKVNFDLKSKYPNVEFCYNNKCIIIRYWGGLKFDKVVFYDSEQINSYSEEEVKIAYMEGCKNPSLHKSHEEKAKEWFKQFKKE